MYFSDDIAEGEQIATQLRKQQHVNDVTNVVYCILQEKFKNYNWRLKTNPDKVEGNNHIIFNKIGNNYEYFEYKLDHNKIYVSVPLKNCQYVTQFIFTDYFKACEYINTHLIDYEINKNV